MQVKIGALYKHYKNGKEYRVLAVGYFTEKDPILECVVYQAQYDTKDLGTKPVFIRPREMFEETLDFHGKMVDRFLLTAEE